MTNKSIHLRVGDRVRLKKPHPCGNHLWEILRVGADIRIKCQGCGRIVMLSRFDLVKDIKEVLVAPAEDRSDRKVYLGIIGRPGQVRVQRARARNAQVPPPLTTIDRTVDRGCAGPHPPDGAWRRWKRITPETISS